MLSDVVPVAGLLAETARGPDFGEADARLLRALADGDRGRTTRALRTVQRFRGWDDAPVDVGDRERLLELLGLHGIRVGLELLDEGRRATPALLEGFARRSGIETVLERIDTVFVAGADRLRASAGIAALEHLGWDATDEVDRRSLLSLQSELDRLRLEPALRQVDLAAALVDLEAGRMRLADERRRPPARPRHRQRRRPAPRARPRRRPRGRGRRGHRPDPGVAARSRPARRGCCSATSAPPARCASTSCSPAHRQAPTWQARSESR